MIPAAFQTDYEYLGNRESGKYVAIIYLILPRANGVLTPRFQSDEKVFGEVMGPHWGYRDDCVANTAFENDIEDPRTRYETIYGDSWEDVKRLRAQLIAATRRQLVAIADNYDQSIANQPPREVTYFSI